MNGFTRDAGALIAIERQSARMNALLLRATETVDAVAVPAAVLAQVWRGGSRQARLARVLAAPETQVVPMNAETARAIGLVCGRTGASDVVDVSVVVCARERDHTVVTSDEADIRRIDPDLPVSVV